ncbi:hypothetical protein ACWGTI_32900, partial [Mesorhizobium sp. ArgA1]
LAIAVPFGVIRDEIGVIFDVAVEFQQLPAQLAHLWRRIGDEIKPIGEVLNKDECSADVAMPKMVFNAFERCDGRGRCGAERRRQAARHLLE